MSKKLIMIICTALLLYILAHWYVATRLSQLFSTDFPAVGSVLLKLILAFGLAYPTGRLANMKMHGNFGDSLIIFGCYWLGALFYATLLLVLFDVIYLLERMLWFLPEYLKPGQSATGWLVVALSGAAVVAGTLNARDVKIRRLVLEVEKQCKINPLTIVSVSDIHLGLLVGLDRLKSLVSQIQQLSPDLVVFPGDILDETIGVFADSRMADELRRLSPRLGVYGCLGSHEYIWGNADKAIHYLEQAGITILRDEFTTIHESFILAGRDDVTRRNFAGHRRNLSDVLQGITPSLPVILLDHTPEDLNAGPSCGVDLQLFGHTHRGQIFPFNLITRMVFDIDWGYVKRNNCHTVISSGYGTWGPPMRIGSKAEILHITLMFVNNQA